MFQRHSLSLLTIAISCAAVAGGFVEPAPTERAAKSPVLSLGYAHKSANFSDTPPNNGGIYLFDQFDGYQVGFAMPVVSGWGLDFTYFSSQSASTTVESGPSQTAEQSGALQTIGMAVSYDLPFALLENLDVSAKLMVEENFYSVYGGYVLSLQENAANGVGLVGAYRFSDKMGLQVGLAYTIPQGVYNIFDSLFTWHASLAYHLS